MHSVILSFISATLVSPVLLPKFRAGEEHFFGILLALFRFVLGRLPFDVNACVKSIAEYLSDGSKVVLLSDAVYDYATGAQNFTVFNNSF